MASEIFMKQNISDQRLFHYDSFFWSPNYLDHSGWIEHVPFAFWIIEAFKPKVLVELGVHNGVSYFSFCQAVEALKIDTECYAVDTWKGDEHAGFYDESVFEKVKDYNTKTFPAFSTLIRSTFDEAKEYFSDGAIDLLHIDGLHTYEAVKHDFDIWLPKLSENGIVIFHDINVRERDFGVLKLWEELSRNYPHFQFDFGYGLGILAVGKIIQPDLKELFNKNNDSSFYSFLTSLFSERGLFFKTNFYRDLELQEATTGLRATTERIAEMEAHILELGAWGKRLDKEMEEKNVLLINTLKESEQLRAENNSKSTSLQKLTTELENKNNLIESFGKSFQDTTAKMLEIQTRLMEQSEWVRKFHYELVEKNQLLHQKEQELDRVYLERNIWSKGDEQVKLELKAAIEAKNELEANAEVFRKQVERLQKNINELHELKVSAEDELNKKDLVITQQSDTIRSLSQNNEQHNNSLKKRDVENEDKKKIIAEQKHQIDDLYVQLQLVNQRLAEIYQSEGWKVLSAYYKIKGKLLPENSKRYARLKSIVNRLRGKKENPVNFNAVRNRQMLPDADKAAQLEPIEFPVFESPSVSIVMPAYNGWALTYRCLASIKKNTFDVAYEIIIGDDASTDETRDIEKYVKNILVIRNERNLEFLHNCNHAASFARGKYILFLNNDTEVCARWLSSMVDLLEQDNSIGMVGSKLIYPNGKLQEAGGIIWSDASGWNFGHNQDPDAPEFNYVKEVDYISGASIIIRTDLWKQIGGFDKRYTPAYCEDSDLAFEVRNRGYKVMYQPLSEVIHFEGYTHGTDQSEGIKGNAIKAYQKRNNEKFREKWEQVLKNEHFANGENVFWARDKSRSKKTILVIDHYVPEFDKDAGSKTVFQYLKLFVSLNCNVKFLGDNFYRHEPYTTMLQQLGIEVLYGPHYASNWQHWISIHGDKLDYILLNRPHVSVKYIDSIKASTRAKILYYGHDLHFLRLTRQFEIEGKKELLEEAENWKKVEMSLFNKADVILTPSLEERDVIKNLGVQQQVVYKPPYFFERKAQPVVDFSQRKDVFFIGGFTHSPNVDAVLWFTREVWPKVRCELPGVKFIIAGSNTPPEIHALANDDVQVLGFVTEEALQKLYEKIKLVVIPLRFGAGVKGKTVEAMFHGIPTVSTEFGLEGLPDYSAFFESYNTGGDFARRITTVYNDDALLLQLSKKEADYVNCNFSFEAARKQIISVLEDNKHSEQRIPVPHSFN
jgi:GT2 family glycosyltransferase